jgi:hypothetical protein
VWFAEKTFAKFGGYFSHAPQPPLQADLLLRPLHCAGCTLFALALHRFFHMSQTSPHTGD